MRKPSGIICTILVACLATFAHAAKAGPPGAKAPSVTHLPGELLEIDDDGVLVRSGFEITSPAHRWFGVYFSLMTAKDEFLKFSKDSGQGDILWSSLFTPDPKTPAPTRWTDIRIRIQNSTISAGLLPAKSTTTLWVVCRIWDDLNRKFIGTPWPSRVPIIVTTDVTGLVVKVEGFDTKPFAPGRNHPTLKIMAREAGLKLEHLKLTKETAIYQGQMPDKSKRLILMNKTANALLTGPSRGMFFEKINSADKACELAKLGCIGGIIVKNETQYQALVESAAKSSGLSPGKGLLSGKPDSFGLDVKAVGSLGWSVTMLIAERTAGSNLLGDVITVEVTVGRDGRISSKQSLCIKAPGDKSKADVYSKALSAVLTPEGSQAINTPKIRGKTIKIPCPTHTKEGDWLDPSHWAGN